MTDISMTDWSGLPNDLYVVSAKSDGIVWNVTMCNVPLAIGPEVRYYQAPDRTALDTAEAHHMMP